MSKLNPDKDAKHRPCMIEAIIFKHDRNIDPGVNCSDGDDGVLRIENIFPGSPFTDCGIEKGDCVQRINDIICGQKSAQWAGRELKRLRKTMTLVVSTVDGDTSEQRTTISKQSPDDSLGINFQLNSDGQLVIFSLSGRQRNWYKHSNLLRTEAPIISINGQDCADGMQPDTATELVRRSSTALVSFVTATRAQNREQHATPNGTCFDCMGILFLCEMLGSCLSMFG
jgi:hypothetical protein